jgi:hypothetical protein
MGNILPSGIVSAVGRVAAAASTAELELWIDLPFNLIQVLRLAHALVEAGCNLHVNPEDAAKLTQLQKVFGLRFEAGTEGVPRLSGLSIDHLKPEARIGSIARPLIFPIAAFDYCRARWPKQRPVRVTFPGLPTTNRKEAIDRWLELSGLKLRVPDPDKKRSIAQRLARKVARRLGLPRREYIHSHGVRFVLSDEGRVFPHKAWNVAYYSWLLESEFVLCPDGDFGGKGIAWTYRFFESVLCGAIPVVENTSEAYEGFKFRRMSEPLSELKWSRDIAEHNFRLAMERLTVPPDELRTEVARLLASHRATAAPMSQVPSVDA